MSMDLFYRALKSRLPERTLSRGRSYHREGRVGRLSIDEEDGAIKALVQGGHLYEVAIGFNQRGFWNLCSCPAAEHGGDDGGRASLSETVGGRLSLAAARRPHAAGAARLKGWRRQARLRPRRQRLHQGRRETFWSVVSGRHSGRIRSARR